MKKLVYLLRDWQIKQLFPCKNSINKVKLKSEFFVKKSWCFLKISVVHKSLVYVLLLFEKCLERVYIQSYIFQQYTEGIDSKKNKLHNLIIKSKYSDSWFLFFSEIKISCKTSSLFPKNNFLILAINTMTLSVL